MYSWYAEMVLYLSNLSEFHEGLNLNADIAPPPPKKKEDMYVSGCNRINRQIHTMAIRGLPSL